jgi:tetratricopeptide (TPR) repeat protein
MGVVKRDADRDFAMAKHYFERARQLNWPAEAIELQLGLTDRASGNLESAADHFEASIALGSAYTAPWTLAPLVSTQLELGRYAEAEKNLERWEVSVSESIAETFAP